MITDGFLSQLISHTLEEMDHQLKGLKLKEVSSADGTCFLLRFENEFQLLIDLYSKLPRFSLSKISSPLKMKHKRSLSNKRAHPQFLEKLKIKLEGSSFEGSSSSSPLSFSLSFKKDNHSFNLALELSARVSHLFLLKDGIHLLSSAFQTQRDKQYIPRKKEIKEPWKAPFKLHRIDLIYREYDQGLYEDQIKERITRHYTSQIKRLEKQLSNLKGALDHVLTYPQLLKEAQLLQSFRHEIKEGQKEIILEDWENPGVPLTISLKPKLGLQKQIDKRFDQVKAYKVRIPELEKEIDFQTQILEKLKKAFEEDLKELKPPPEPEIKKKKAPQQKLPYRLFKLRGGAEALVGRSARDNMELSFRIANGNDTWMHVHNYAGSHVVVRGLSSGNEEGFIDAALLTQHYSKSKEAISEVTLTEAKYLHRIPGAKAGKVSVSHHRVFEVQRDPKRLKELFLENDLSNPSG